MAGIVWILGAGFSKPLGGPLLPDLLSTGSWDRIRAAFPERQGVLLDSRAWPTIKDLLRNHGWNSENVPAPAWQDAEEFLEFLDLAASGNNSQARQLLNRYCGALADSDPRRIAWKAKQLVAAECWQFTMNADSASEKWSPYVKWASELQSDDTVVTFNYDRVIEIAGKAATAPLKVMLGCEGVSPSEIRVLKLHGSVGWLMNNDKIWEIPEVDFGTLPDEEIAIATPGPSKKAFSDRMNNLWEQARTAIMAADAVIFVGYRFPPTDALARERILGAIADARERPCLAVHTVLGLNRSEDISRLEQLLRYALHRGGRRPVDKPDPKAPGAKQYDLLVHPLWAQDFLGLASRDEILRPRKHGLV